MAERDILKLLSVLHQTSGYPVFKPLYDRAMKTLTEMAVEEKKVLDEEAKKEAAEKLEEEGKIAAAKAAEAKLKEVEAHEAKEKEEAEIKASAKKVIAERPEERR
jgi:hypothetical protein